MHHIAVCNSDAKWCTVLVSENVHQPRGVAVWPERGQLFWSDWGYNPMIARASMDGNNLISIVNKSIYWPNGIALDIYNNRLYWVDAKTAHIESVRPDGTQRRVLPISKTLIKHPYGLALFENRVYWSDWNTKSLHSCHKFTGGEHQVLLKDRVIYSIDIYRPVDRQNLSHPCTDNRCTHFCLLAENNTYTCACPEGMELAGDKLRCLKVLKLPRLFVGIHNYLLESEHTILGRHVITTMHTLSINVDQMAYNMVNNTIFIVDNTAHQIGVYDPKLSKTDILLNTNGRNITDITFGKIILY